MNDAFLDIDEAEKKLVTDVLDAVNDMKDTFLRFQNRELGDKQRIMILVQSYTNIVNYWNPLHSHHIKNDEFFVDAMDSIARKIRNMMNKLPSIEDYDSIRLRLQALYNFCYILISFRTGKESMFKMQGVANILVNVLTGVVPIEKIELPSIDNPKFMRILERNVTYLFSTSLMLISVIRGSPVIHQDNLLSWTKSIYKFNDQLHLLTSNLPLRVIYQRYYNRSESQFYSNTEILTQWRFHFISATALLQKIIGTELTSIIETPLLESMEDPIFSAIEKINRLRDKLLDDIGELFKQGNLSANYPPETAKELQYSRNYHLFDNIRQSRYKLFKSTVRNFNQIEEEEIIKAIMNGVSVLRGLEEASNDTEIMFKPEDLIYYVDNLKETMVLLALKCRNDEMYDEFLSEMKFLIENATLIEDTTYPDIKLLAILLKLYCISELEVFDQMNRIIPDLNDLMEIIEYDIQIYSSCLILELLIQLRDTPNPELIDNQFFLIESKLSTGFSHLIEPVTIYKTHLKGIVRNEKSFSPPLISVNYLDYYSWLTPKFPINGKLVEYIPLNLLSQKITLA